jgi:hypothetical protein
MIKRYPHISNSKFVTHYFILLIYPLNRLLFGQ